MRKFHRIAGWLFCLPVLLTGCITQNMVVVVEPDGSGQIAITRVMSADALQAVRLWTDRVREIEGDDFAMKLAGGFDQPLYDPDTLSRVAEWMGEGVRFVEARPIDRGTAKGVQVLYAFDHIDNVQINPHAVFGAAIAWANLDDLERVMRRGSLELIHFEFEDDSGTKILRCHLPAGMTQREEEWARIQSLTAPQYEDVQDSVLSPLGAGLGLVGDMALGITSSDSYLDWVRMVFAGTRFGLAVEVRGELLETTAQHPSPSRPNQVILYDIPFDRFLSDPEFEIMLDDMNPIMIGVWSDLEMNMLYAIPQVTVQSTPDITIRFK